MLIEEGIFPVFFLLIDVIGFRYTYTTLCKGKFLTRVPSLIGTASNPLGGLRLGGAT